MTIDDFKKKLRNLEPGRVLTYHMGNLAQDRENNEVVNKIASLALSVDELGYGTVFQQRVPFMRSAFHYQVRVFRNLGMRIDGNGSFQEIERVAKLHEETIRIGRDAI